MKIKSMLNMFNIVTVKLSISHATMTQILYNIHIQNVPI